MGCWIGAAVAVGVVGVLLRWDMNEAAPWPLFVLICATGSTTDARGPTFLLDALFVCSLLLNGVVYLTCSSWVAACMCCACALCCVLVVSRRRERACEVRADETRTWMPRVAEALGHVLRVVAVILLVMSCAQSFIWAADSSHVWAAPRGYVTERCSTDGITCVQHHWDCTPVHDAGSTTVILESGLPYTSNAWQSVLQECGTSCHRSIRRVCAYDRAGYGWSGSPPLRTSRTARQLADELHLSIGVIAADTDVFLVGWSFGGAIVRSYIQSYPEAVSGCVMVDSVLGDDSQKLDGFLTDVHTGIVSFSAMQLFTPLGITSIGLWLGLLPPEAGYYPRGLARSQLEVGDAQLRSMAFPSTARRELSGLLEGEEEMADCSSGCFGSIPLVILVANGDADATWWEWQRSSLADLSSTSEMIAADTSHFVPFEDAPAIVRAITRCVELREQ